MCFTFLIISFFNTKISAGTKIVAAQLSVPPDVICGVIEDLILNFDFVSLTIFLYNNHNNNWKKFICFSGVSSAAGLYSCPVFTVFTINTKNPEHNLHVA